MRLALAVRLLHTCLHQTRCWVEDIRIRVLAGRERECKHYQPARTLDIYACHFCVSLFQVLVFGSHPVTRNRRWNPTWQADWRSSSAMVSALGDDSTSVHRVRPRAGHNRRRPIVTLEEYAILAPGDSPLQAAVRSAVATERCIAFVTARCSLPA